ncbi:MAG: hypothetical protein ACKV2U_17775 [Bryobacteraceae bacterium]
MKKVVMWLALVLVGGLAVVSVIVQVEGDYAHEALGGEGKAKALVLFHPSRDARFSDDLSLAFAAGLIEAGFTVERATLTRRTPASPEGYRIVGVVSNTYYWTPDLPTLRYLKRARLHGVAVVGLAGGAGATGRSQRVLDEALRATGGKVIQTRSFWLWRPNDERHMNEPNREVALRRARQFGVESGRAVMAGVKAPHPGPTSAKR